MKQRVVVIGGGIGGLAAAIDLAVAGCDVVLFEATDRVGGKMGEIQSDGFRWDTGPSVITMPDVLTGLLRDSGADPDDYLTLQPVEPITRYFWPDGTVLNISRDLPRTLDGIRDISEGDVEGWLGFFAYAARLHRITGPTFLYGPPPKVTDLFRMKPRDALNVDGMRTMAAAIDSFVASPLLRQLLKRFATYVGGDPFRAPAPLNVIADVEINRGVIYPVGGVYAIAAALERRARELGVSIRPECRVESITVVNGVVRGVALAGGETIDADVVVANADASDVYESLLPADVIPKKERQRQKESEPSSSGFALLLGIKGQDERLAHHNILFSSDYQREFREIFDEGVPPSEPTVYIAITSKTNPDHAPVGCENWFVLVNAPALGERWDWAARSAEYRDRVIERIESFGFTVRDRIVAEHILTPEDIARQTGAHRGALYGMSPNGRFAAFRRPRNRVATVKGLYLCGGTTHPGGGVPMVVLSGRLAARYAMNETV